MPSRPRCIGAVFMLSLACGAVGCATAPETAPALPGSARHARVAMATDAGRMPVTFLARSMTDEDRSSLGRTSPNVHIVIGRSRDEALRMAPEVHGIDGSYLSGEMLRAAPNLRWVQNLSAGVDRALRVDELRERDEIVFTNMQGIHGPTIADHVFAMLLTLTRDLAFYTDPARAGEWDRAGSGVERIALKDRTLLVVGLGGIGREVAKRGKGFDMRVLATRRSATPPPAYVDRQGTPADLPEMLAEADVVVLCVPLTPETEGMIGAEELALMPPGSYLINIARGKVVDTGALLAALDRGHLAGAGLDVTDPEPLPPGHPLWGRSNVVITPHVASRSALTGTRRRALLVENLRRFGAGEPLLNVVDKKAGY